jgi:hypothetical protein
MLSTLAYALLTGLIRPSIGLDELLMKSEAPSPGKHLFTVSK